MPCLQSDHTLRALRDAPASRAWGVERNLLFVVGHLPPPRPHDKANKVKDDLTNNRGMAGRLRGGWGGVFEGFGEVAGLFSAFSGL